MISKETTMAIAISVYLQAQRHYDHPGFKTGKLYGSYSRHTIHGTSPEVLEEWYGKKVFQLHPAFKLDNDAAWKQVIGEITADEIGEKQKISKRHWKEVHKTVPADTEYMRTGHIGSIDTYIGDPFPDTDDKFDADEEAPHGLRMNQLEQVIDWDEVWADEDFTTVSTKSFWTTFYDEYQPSEELRIIDINAALEHHGLPTMVDLVKKPIRVIPAPTYEESEAVITLKALQASNPKLYGDLTLGDPAKYVEPDDTYEYAPGEEPAFVEFVDEYLRIASKDPRTIKSYAYYTLDY